MSTPPSKGGKATRVLKGLALLRPGLLEGLLFDGRGEALANPYDQARALAQVSTALAEWKDHLSPPLFKRVRDVLRRLSEVDWPTAAALAPRIGDVAREGPAQALGLLADTLLHLAPLDASASRLLAEKLPTLLLALPTPERRIHLLLALDRVAPRCPDVSLLLLEELPGLLEQLTVRSLQLFLDEALRRLPDGKAKVRSFLLRESQEGRTLWEELRSGLPLSRVARTLQLYAEAHCGGPVQIRSMDALPAGVMPPEGAVSLTDGTHIYLVPWMTRYPDEKGNFRLYKLATAHEAAHMEFGTFTLALEEVRWPKDMELAPLRRSPGRGLAAYLASFPDEPLGARLFMLMEDSRIDHRIRGLYPGLGREMDELAAEEIGHRPDPSTLSPRHRALEILARLVWFDDAGIPESEIPPWIRAAWLMATTLRRSESTVVDAANTAARVYTLLLPYLPAEEEAPGLRSSLTLEPDAEGGEGPQDEDDRSSSSAREKTLEKRRFSSAEGSLPYQGLLAFDLEEALQEAEEGRARRIQQVLADRGIDVPLHEVFRVLNADPDVPDGVIERGLLESHRDRLGRRNDDFWERDVPGTSPGGPLPEGSLQGETGSPLRVFRYPEWDRAISDYRPGWTTVRERQAQATDPTFVGETLAQHRALVGRMRRQFQMIRAIQRGQSRGWTEGDDIDLDAVISGIAERRAGHLPDQRYYFRRLRPERDVAVAFLVDLSASTKEGVGRSGRTVIEVQKQALILLSEALDALGDRYAVFGFSGRGRSHVTFDVVKSFDDHHPGTIKDRIGGMTHQMENRDGAAIRHATCLLAAQEARVRLLILLSDGRPLDCGCEHYNDRYAQEDTRTALRETMARHIHPFCITVDRRGEDYLAAMYGDVRYTVIDRVESLPEKLPSIYRRLTS